MKRDITNLVEHTIWKESSTKERWDAIERNVRMYEKTGVWTFDERIMQIQLKSLNIECNLDCHMCNHDSSSMRIDMMTNMMFIVKRCLIQWKILDVKLNLLKII